MCMPPLPALAENEAHAPRLTLSKVLAQNVRTFAFVEGTLVLLHPELDDPPMTYAVDADA